MEYILIIVVLLVVVALVGMYNNLKKFQLKMSDARKDLDVMAQAGQPQTQEAQEKLLAAIKYYDATVSDMNNLINTPPYNYVSGLLGFKPQTPFNEQQTTAPQAAESVPVTQATANTTASATAATDVVPPEPQQPQPQQQPQEPTKAAE